MRFLRAVLIASMIVVASPQTACAIMLLHYDMASMAYGAEAIVLVEEPAYQKDVSYERGQARVVESFKGPFKAGDLVPLTIPLGYSRRPYNGGSEYPRELALLFLVRGRATEDLVPSPSGVKLINKEGVFRFVQRMNPGPYSPDPMRAELISWPAGTAYDREALSLDLRAAMEKAARFQAALEAHDFATLAGFIKNADKAEREYQRMDKLSYLAAQAFGEHGNLELNLEILAKRYGRLDSIEFREIAAPFRTAAGYYFLLAKSATLKKGAAAETVRELLAEIRSDKDLLRKLRHEPK